MLGMTHTQAAEAVRALTRKLDRKQAEVDRLSAQRIDAVAVLLDNGYSVAEVAAAIGKSRAAAHKVVTRARVRLAELVAQEYGAA